MCNSCKYLKSFSLKKYSFFPHLYHLPSQLFNFDANKGGSPSLFNCAISKSYSTLLALLQNCTNIFSEILQVANCKLLL